MTKGYGQQEIHETSINVADEFYLSFCDFCQYKHGQSVAMYSVTIDDCSCKWAPCVITVCDEKLDETLVELNEFCESV